MATRRSTSPFAPTGRARSGRALWPSAPALIGIRAMIGLDRIAQVVISAPADAFQYPSSHARAVGPAPEQHRAIDDTGLTAFLLANGSPCGTPQAAPADLGGTVSPILDCNRVRPDGGRR